MKKKGNKGKKWRHKTKSRKRRSSRKERQKSKNNKEQQRKSSRRRKVKAAVTLHSDTHTNPFSVAEKKSVYKDVLPHPDSVLIWQPTILCTVENTSCQASVTAYSMHINNGCVPNCIICTLKFCYDGHGRKFKEHDEDRAACHNCLNTVCRLCDGGHSDHNQ